MRGYITVRGELPSYLQLLFMQEDIKEFATLSFNRSFNFESAMGPVDEFFRQIMKTMYGCNDNENISREMNFVVVGFIEHRGENVHFHMGIAGEKHVLEFLRMNGDTIWKKKQPQGDYLSSNIRDVLHVARYSTKTYRNRDSQEQLYIYIFPEPEAVDKAANKLLMTVEERRAQMWRNKQERSLRLHGKIKNTKKNRGKMARYGSFQKRV